MRVVRFRSHTAFNAKVYTAFSVIGCSGVALSLLYAESISIASLCINLFLCASLLLFSLPRAILYLKGEAGERSVLRALRVLPDSYTTVTSFSTKGKRVGDTDILLFGPHGVMTLEVKRYSGTVMYEQGRWWRILPDGAKRALKNVSYQARTQSRQMQTIVMQLKETDPEMPSNYIPVQGVIVFVGRVRLNLIGLDIPAVKVEDLKEYILKQPAYLEHAQVCGLLRAFLKRYAA
jgi:hypothetical protein